MIAPPAAPAPEHVVLDGSAVSRSALVNVVVADRGSGRSIAVRTPHMLPEGGR